MSETDSRREDGKAQRAETAREAVEAADPEGLVAPDGVNEQGVQPERTGE